MDDSWTPDKGEHMDRKAHLSIVRDSYTPVASGHEAIPHPLLDLSISDGQPEPDHTMWRVRVAVPLVRGENVSLRGVSRAVGQKLVGRLPDAYYNRIHERFVTSFAIHDTSAESFEEVGRFTLSLINALESMQPGPPRVYLERHCQTVREITSY